MVERIPARSFGLSRAGADVILQSTPSSCAVICARVVFPSPGGPIKRRWSSGSSLWRAASIKVDRLFFTVVCPRKSFKSLGRRVASCSSESVFKSARTIDEKPSVLSELKSVIFFIISESPAIPQAGRKSVRRTDGTCILTMKVQL